MTVQILYCSADLSDDYLHFPHCKPAASAVFHEGEESPAACEFLNEVDPALIMEDSVQFGDIDVVAEQLYLKLRGQSLNHL